MVTVAFYKGKGKWWNSLIRWWTRGPYSHTEVITEQYGDRYLCHSSHLPDGGVRSKWRVLDASEWDFVDIDADSYAISKWYDERHGKKYDLLGLVGFVLRPEDGERDKYFCSEANAASLGIKQPWRFDPNTLKPVIDALSMYKRK
mgnify:CR=1 FL=1